MSGLRIGSLCTGTGALDVAVQAAYGGTVAWHCQYEPPDKKGKPDRHQYAAQILAHHWPAIPNHGDLTAIDWTAVEPVDVLTMGFPCQDVSLAGLRAGLLDGNRSGLWRHCARAIAALQPELVVIENVPGLLSSPADGDVEPCPWCLGDTDDEPPLRALGAVLADLHGLGFDAEWTSLAASDIGACHRRNRIFILAWPTDPEGAGLQARREGRPARNPADAADAEHAGLARITAPRCAAGGQPLGESAGRSADTPAHAPGDGRDEWRTEPARLGRRPDAAIGGRATPADAARHQGRIDDRDGSTAPDTHRGGLPQHPERDSGPQDGQRSTRRLDPERRGVQRRTTSDTANGVQPQQPQSRDRSELGTGAGAGGRTRSRADTEGASGPRGDSELLALGRTPADTADLRCERGGHHGDGGPDLRTAVGALAADADSESGEQRRDAAAGEAEGGRAPAVDCGCDRASWGAYLPAVHRWEQLMGRPAPSPVDDRGRLAPPFVEWLMGLPSGHVTAVPGIPRNAQLKALGNGVVPQQAEAAIRLLHARQQEAA